jgi:hypothetical protein
MERLDCGIRCSHGHQHAQRLVAYGRRTQYLVLSHCPRSRYSRVSHIHVSIGPFISTKSHILEYLAITLGVAILMQTMEIVTKLVYYKIWVYPGWLYFVFVFPLWFILITYALVRFTRAKWGMALLISVLDFIGSLLVGGLFAEIIGLETPGS